MRLIAPLTVPYHPRNSRVGSQANCPWHHNLLTHVLPCPCALAVTAQFESVKRAKATGCWSLKSLCPQVDVDLKEDELLEHSAKARQWFSTVRKHAQEHHGTPLLQLTTEEFVNATPSSRHALLGSFFRNAMTATPSDVQAAVQHRHLPRETSWPASGAGLGTRNSEPSESARKGSVWANKSSTTPGHSWLQRGAERAGSCDLCADHWVFVFATGRSGSTSIMEALNSLPGVRLASENQGSLEVSSTLFEMPPPPVALPPHTFCPPTI